MSQLVVNVPVLRGARALPSQILTPSFVSHRLMRCQKLQ